MATADVPAAQNINKLVIGGNNVKPQMGLFALREPEAKAVQAAMARGLEPAYTLALLATATKTWVGDRNYCSDAVRVTIQYLGTDGMLDDAAWERWRTASLAELEAKHLGEINKLHEQMMGESDPAACKASLRAYAEALTFAATQQLVLLNFGF
ncbi:MAG: hypothetical protein M3680_18385 [Myxococcota bacterium]|nr:hypothetical protein [Myxococcota bacterium]